MSLAYHFPRWTTSSGGRRPRRRWQRLTNTVVPGQRRGHDPNHAPSDSIARRSSATREYRERREKLRRNLNGPSPDSPPYSAPREHHPSLRQGYGDGGDATTWLRPLCGPSCCTRPPPSPLWLQDASPSLL